MYLDMQTRRYVCSICCHSMARSQLLGIQSALCRNALRSTQALQLRAREPRGALDLAVAITMYCVLMYIYIVYAPSTKGR